MSVLPVAGCKFPAVFLGKVALDVVSLGVGPPYLRVDSEETLLTLIDERAQLARAAPGITPVDSSEEGAPVRELIRPSVLGEALVDSLQEPMPVEKRLEYAIQATSSVWEPLELVHYVVSGDVNFDSFGMAPCDAGGMHSDGCRLYGTCWKMMLQWLFRLSCRPVIVNGLDRTMRMNTEYGLDKIMMTHTDSPRLVVTPGEWYASDMLTTMRPDLRQMIGIPEVIGAMYDCRTVWGFPQIVSTMVDCGTVELDDLTFRRTSFPPDELSAGRDRNYLEDYSIVWGFPQIDSAAVDCDTGAVELDDLIFRRTSFPPDRLSAGRYGAYIWLALLAGLSVHTPSVTGSLPFGSPHRLGRCCLLLAALSLRWIGSADVPLCRHLLSAVIRSASHEVEIYWVFPLYRHPVLPDAEALGMYLYAPLCRHLLSFDPAVRRTASCEVEMYSPPPCFRLILMFCYCFYGFFRERDIASGRSPDRDLVDPFLHAPTRSAKLYDIAPDIQDAMELRVLRPHAILVKVISVWNSQGSRMMIPSDLAPCGWHEFLLGRSGAVVHDDR